MATTTPVVITSARAFTDAFDGEQLGTSQGRWRYDTGGTSATGNTGPGNNNVLSFMHTEVSNIPDTETLEDAEERGVAAFVTVPDQVDRTLHMRLCIQGDFHNGIEGLEIQQRATDADAWANVFHVHGWDYSNTWDAGDIITDDTGFTTTPVPTVTTSTGIGSGAVLSSITVGADGRINSLTWASGGSDYAVGDVLLITQAGPNGDSVGSFSIADGNWIVGGVLQDITGVFIAGGVERTAAADGGWIDFEIPIPDTAAQVRIHPRYFDGGGPTYRHDVALRSFFWEWPDVTDHAVDAGSIDIQVALPEPSVDHNQTHEITASGSIAIAVALPAPSVTHTPRPATDHSVDGGSIDIGIALPQPAVTHTTLSGTDYTVDAGAIAIGIALPAPSVTRAAPALAQAGPDQSVQADDRVMLNGSASTVGNGQIAGYEWQQHTGERVDLAGRFDPVAYFQAPSAPVRRKYSFSLQVRSTLGAQDIDYITITVAAQSSLIQRPIAAALAEIDHLDLLLDQYTESTNLIALLEGIIKIGQDNIIAPMERAQRGLNPDESTGILLDWIGHRLDMPRPYVLASDAEFFGFEGTEAAGGKPWDQAPFFTQRAGIEQVEPVGDATYRKLLKARARRLRGGANRETIEAVLNILFGNGYLDESTAALTLHITVATADVVLYALVAGRLKESVIPRPAGREITLAQV